MLFLKGGWLLIEVAEARYVDVETEGCANQPDHGERAFFRMVKGAVHPKAGDDRPENEPSHANELLSPLRARGILFGHRSCVQPLAFFWRGEEASGLPLSANH